MTEIQSEQNEIFNTKLFISPPLYQTKFFSPNKEKSETDDNSNPSSSQSKKTMSSFSTEKKKSEACLMTELLTLLDECSPVKSNEKLPNDPPTSSFMLENYLIEGYLNKSNKENRNINNCFESVAKKLNFNPIEVEIGNRPQKENFNFFKNKKHKKNSKYFTERVGDWECSHCKNLNFSFRKKCNRCQCDKQKSERQYSIISNNLLSMLRDIN